MKSFKRLTLLMLPLALHCVAAETTNTFYVAEGETKTVDEIVAANGFTFKAGDWIRKTGRGQLNAVATYKDEVGRCIGWAVSGYVWRIEFWA